MIVRWLSRLLMLAMACGALVLPFMIPVDEEAISTAPPKTHTIPTENKNTAQSDGLIPGPPTTPEPEPEIEGSKIGDIVEEATRSIELDGLVPAPEKTGPLVRIAPPEKPEPKAQPEKIEPDVYHRIVVMDAGSFQTGSTRIHFSDVQALLPDDLCTLEDKTTWPCGRMAKTSLRSLIRTRSVSCTPYEMAGETDSLRARCHVGTININHWLIEQGWAKPLIKGSTRLDDLLAEAKSRHVGQWKTSRP